MLKRRSKTTAKEIETPHHTTPRLCLRRFTVEDAPVVERLAGESDVALMTVIPHPYPAGGGREWIERSAAPIEEGRLRQFAVTLAKTDELMGCLTLRKKSVGDPEAEVAYWLGKEYWGHGYMAEAARAALNQVRTSFGVDRVWAGVLVENRQSVRVLEKIGLAYVDTFADRWEVRDLDVVLPRYRMNLSGT